MTDIRTIAQKLNAKSELHQIGRLQDLRKELKKLAKRPGSSIFTDQTIFDNYAFHHGGRSELQFNIGFDGSDGKLLRHGVAFSFEKSQTLPDIYRLRPNVSRFNEYLQLYPNKYSRMRMWHWDVHARSGDYMPSPIPSERIHDGVFVFLGVLNSIGTIDIDQILGDFDDLLPLYKYVESNGAAEPLTVVDLAPFQFVHGCTVKKLKATAQTTGDPVDVELRHNSLQLRLYNVLVNEFGEKNVGTELQTGNGTRIDVVVQNQTGYWFYEIKIYHSPRA